MRVAIHQPNLWPWLGFFAKAKQADILVLLDDVPFSKGSYTNRVQIRGPKGPEWATVPVRHRLGQLIRDVKIDGNEWEPRIFAQLHRAYRASPMWRLAEESVSAVVASDESLADRNRNAITSMLEEFSLEVQIDSSSSLRSDVRPGTAGLIDLVRAVGGTHYVAGRGAAKYDDLAAWKSAGIGYEVARFAPPDALGLSALDVIVGDEHPGDVLARCIR